MRWLILIMLPMVLNLSYHVETYASDSPFESNTTPRDSLSAEQLLERSKDYTYSQPEKAIEYAQKAISAAGGNGNHKIEIKALHQLGSIFISRGNRAAAKPNFETAIEKARGIDDPLLTANGYYNLSFFYEEDSNYSLALDYLGRSLSIYKLLDRKADIARAYSSFGRVYQKIGDYEEALQYYFQSLKLNEQLDRKRGISIVKTNIGHSYLNTSRLEQAERYFKEALAIDKENNDKEGILINTLNLGVVKEKSGKLDEALGYYRTALSLARELQYQVDEAILLGNIGSALMQKGDLEQGLHHLQSSLSLRRQIDYNASHTLNNISETYLALGDPVSAAGYALQAVEEAQQRDDLDQLQDAYLNLSNAYKAQGDYKCSYSALTQSNATKDSLFSLEKERQMNELEVAYQTEKKEQEIALLTLQKENAEFRRNTYLGAGILATLILLLLYQNQHSKNKRNRQLLEKEKEVAEMKSNFFSNISHEFRTPLMLISGPLELIKAKTEDTGIQRQLKILETNTDRLLSLINQLLKLSKLESGKLELSRQPTDILMLVKGVTMSFGSLAEMNNITLEVGSELKNLNLKIDLEKLETILINLVNNAFNNTPAGGKINVITGIEKKGSENPSCQISVRDSGRGIPAGELSHIFNRFYGGDSAENNGTGTGIGLALTKELVELHGGSINVSSKEHEWTEFVIQLPIGDDDFYEIADSEMVETQRAMSVGSRSEKRAFPADENREDDASLPIVLLIEDNIDVARYLEEILKDSYQMIKAADGKEGVEMAFEQIPDLIVSDVMMPEMDGYQVAETLKQDEKTSHIPLILLTAKASQQDKIQGLKTHVDEYLTKPFRPEELRVRIQNLIQSRRQLREKYKREYMMKPDEVSVHSLDDAFLIRVKNVVDKHIDNEDFTVEQLGKEVGMSRSQLHRKLTALIDQSATEFIRSYRLHRAKDMISREAGTIAEISYAVGFGSPSYFSKCFREEFGTSPTESRDNSA